MPDDFSDEELVLTDSDCASPILPSLPTLPESIPGPKAVDMHKGQKAADPRTLMSTGTFPGEIHTVVLKAYRLCKLAAQITYSGANSSRSMADAIRSC